MNLPLVITFLVLCRIAHVQFQANPHLGLTATFVSHPDPFAQSISLTSVSGDSVSYVGDTGDVII